MNRENPEGDEKVTITLPSHEEFEKADILALQRQWRENHQKLLQRIEQGNVPFFGLHGTPHAREIALSGANNLEFATFYKKDDSDFFYINFMKPLFMLHAMPDAKKRMM